MAKGKTEQRRAVNAPLIELVNASVDLDDERRLVGITFNVTRGEFVCLHGSTGSGKSLSLKLIAGLIRPSAGEVRVAGERINDFTEREKLWMRRSMGIMVQDMQLLEDRMVLENVMLPALASEASFSEARKRAGSALKKCRIEHLARLRPHELSAGQKQLALLARAVVNHPVVILADEPAAHLDAENAQILMDLLGEFSQAGVCVILASHLELMPRSVACRSIHLDGRQRIVKESAS